MQRVSECESVVFCGAAPPLRGGAAKTSLSIQKVFDCKWYYTSKKHAIPIPLPGPPMQPTGFHLSLLSAPYAFPWPTALAAFNSAAGRDPHLDPPPEPPLKIPKFIRSPLMAPLENALSLSRV
jgi:hypothetical protein